MGYDERTVHEPGSLSALLSQRLGQLAVTLSQNARARASTRWASSTGDEILVRSLQRQGVHRVGRGPPQRNRGRTRCLPAGIRGPRALGATQGHVPGDGGSGWEVDATVRVPGAGMITAHFLVPTCGVPIRDGARRVPFAERPSTVGCRRVSGPFL